MTAKTMRSFAGGILVAATLLALVHFLSPNGVQSKEKLSATEMKKELTSEGYVVLTEEEWDAQLTAVKDDKDTGKDTNKDNKDQTQTNPENAVYKTIIGVSSGMTSIDVGNALASSKIIPNAFEFTQEVEKRGLSTRLKPGMYEVQSGMTMDQLIAVIFP